MIGINAEGHLKLMSHHHSFNPSNSGPSGALVSCRCPAVRTFCSFVYCIDVFFALNKSQNVLRFRVLDSCLFHNTYS